MYKQKLILIGLIAGCISLSLFNTSCKKESGENTTNFNENQLNTAFVYYEQNELETKLNKLWKNYATFNGIVLNNGQVANLNETISASEAATLLHYGLNLSIVNPRIGYANELADSFECNLTLNAAGNITYDALCNTLQSIANHLKQVRQGIANENKALNRLEIIMPQEGAGTTISVKAKYLFSFGPVWSVDELTNEANHTPIGIQFNAPTPWISQQSFEGVENPNNQNSGQVPAYQQQYYMWVFTNIDHSTTLTQRQNTFNSSLENAKALHHYLTNRAVYWPNPAQQLNGWFPNYNGVVPVMTPNFIISGTGPVIFKGEFRPNDPTFGAVITTDVIECDNPNKPSVGTQPTETNMVPSKLLGYYGKEYDYSLSTARKVDQNTINFFWAKRPEIAVVSVNKNSSDINQRMNHFNSGFYAMTGYHTLPNKNRNYTGLCQSGTVCNGGNVCLYATEYYVEGEFSHYRLLPPTPAQLGQFF
jgi:hypothetical protein